MFQTQQKERGQKNQRDKGRDRQTDKQSFISKGEAQKLRVRDLRTDGSRAKVNYINSFEVCNVANVSFVFGNLHNFLNLLTIV